MEAVRSLRGFALVVRAPAQPVTDSDPFDHENLVLDNDVALSIRGQLPLGGVDPARLQRASQGARQSTGRRSNHVVQGGRMVRVLARRGAVVLAYLVMSAKDDRIRLAREKRSSDGAALANDPDTRDVDGGVLHIPYYAAH